jgi:hypothetical protein
MTATLDAHLANMTLAAGLSTGLLCNLTLNGLTRYGILIVA